MALTERKNTFCWEYVANGYNAIAAYLVIHPEASQGSARNGSYRYMKDPEVKEYLKELITGIYDGKMINAETIASELALVAYQRREVLAADYNEGAKLKALELLQKQFGLQTQKIEAKVEKVIFMGDEALED